MFRIGEFSRLCQVSVKALRYYDEIGLLKPARTDDLTGYRYYSDEQLACLKRVRALKDMGFSLEETARLMNEDPQPERIREMLKRKRGELRQRVKAEQARLARVEARLWEIDREISRKGAPPEYDVAVRRVDSYTVAAVRDVIPTYRDVHPLLREVFTYLQRCGLCPTSPPFAIWYDPECRDQDIDSEAVVPIAEMARGNGRVTVRRLPGVDAMACATHAGTYDALGEAYTAVLIWIKANGWQIDGPLREVYLRWQGTMPSQASCLMEVQFPVRRLT
jgi:DNA-binding transcriptional MerR regulator/effector-binding domain-containing protein